MWPGACDNALKDPHLPALQSDISVNHMAKMGSSQAPDLAALSLDNVSMSEMDKAAMLTMIREEVPRPPPPTTLSASHDGMWVQRFTWAFCLVSVLAWCYQIITKEIEVNEWKRKYEECRVEVTEMRLGQRDVFARGLQSEIQVTNVNKCHQFVWENFFIPLADRKIVAEYERTVAQMIGELAPPAGSMLYVCRYFNRGENKLCQS